jgi:hypothetical protein
MKTENTEHFLAKENGGEKQVSCADIEGWIFLFVLFAAWKASQGNVEHHIEPNLRLDCPRAAQNTPPLHSQAPPPLPLPPSYQEELPCEGGEETPRVRPWVTPLQLPWPVPESISVLERFFCIPFLASHLRPEIVFAGKRRSNSSAATRESETFSGRASFDRSASFDRIASSDRNGSGNDRRRSCTPSCRAGSAEGSGLPGWCPTGSRSSSTPDCVIEKGQRG